MIKQILSDWYKTSDISAGDKMLERTKKILSFAPSYSADTVHAARRTQSALIACKAANVNYSARKFNTAVAMLGGLFAWGFLSEKYASTFWRWSGVVPQTRWGKALVFAGELVPFVGVGVAFNRMGELDTRKTLAMAYGRTADVVCENSKCNDSKDIEGLEVQVFMSANEPLLYNALRDVPYSSGLANFVGVAIAAGITLGNDNINVEELCNFKLDFDFSKPILPSSIERLVNKSDSVTACFDRT